jgi:glycosyltransferase involved in cell wall biosynthesis
MRKKMVIITPTYNRMNTLPRLYESLKSQNDKNFEWLIIDDGSIDGTNLYVERIIKENIIQIKYLFQKNGGKSRALNLGFSSVNDTTIFVVVDSDDLLHPIATETIFKYMDRYSDNDEVGAFFFHYETNKGKIINSKGKAIEQDHLMTRYQYNNKFKSNDGCICYLSKVVSKYKYPEFDGEKYVGPTVLQMEMADEYKIVFSPTVIGVAEYLEGGLTGKGRLLRLRNPMGMIYYAKLMMSPKSSVFTQIKYAISIWPYANIANKSFIDIVKMVGRPVILLVTYIPGQILSIYWNRKTSDS